MGFSQHKSFISVISFSSCHLANSVLYRRRRRCLNQFTVRDTTSYHHSPEVSPLQPPSLFSSLSASEKLALRKPSHLPTPSQIKNPLTGSPTPLSDAPLPTSLHLFAWAKAGLGQSTAELSKAQLPIMFQWPLKSWIQGPYKASANSKMSCSYLVKSTLNT